MVKAYLCPVCKKPLSKQEYEQALGILGARDEHFKHANDELKKKLREAKTSATRAKEEGIKFERARTQRLLAGKDKQIQLWKDRVDQLKKGSTPQTEGLEFEDELTSRLKREFPEDIVQHKGKGGDILHIVYFNKKQAGIIVYECKRTPRIQTQHVHQAHLAKQSREADFAVLVTTGQAKGFSGFAEMKGVLVVSPLGTIPLASLLRQHIIEMLKAKIGKEKRAIIAQQLIAYISSPQFKNPIEEVVQITTELQGMIQDEAKVHFRTWKKRWEHYQKIHWDNTLIQGNLQLVLHGKEPKAVIRPTIAPLQLPAASE